MPYTITERDRRRMRNIFFQMFRFMALSAKFMKLTRLGADLGPRAGGTQSAGPEAPRVRKAS
jgi:hypothetical protein